MGIRKGESHCDARVFNSRMVSPPEDALREGLELVAETER